MFVPIYLLIVNSLKTRSEASSMGIDLPAAFQWSNFAVVIEKGKLATAFGNSMLYAVAATLIGTMWPRWPPMYCHATARASIA